MTTNHETTTETARYALNWLVTDAIAYEVIARTAKTITVRSMKHGENIESRNIDGNPFPRVVERALPNPDGETHVLRLRKDGTYRLYRGGNPLHFTQDPVFVTDYRY